MGLAVPQLVWTRHICSGLVITAFKKTNYPVEEPKGDVLKYGLLDSTCYTIKAETNTGVPDWLIIMSG